MRSPALPLLCLALSACDGAGKRDGAFAIVFDGTSSSAEVDMSGAVFPGSFTVEAWVQADESVTYGLHPVLVWLGAFSLYADAEGAGLFTDGADLGGAQAGSGWMDGDPHHVAGTWDGESVSIYIDGERRGFGSATLGGAPGSTLYVGCWPEQGAVHDGLIDELRMSATVRYTDDFDPPTLPFEVDDDTLTLWHFDEGSGKVARDAAGQLNLSVDGVRWEAFAPSGDAR